MNELLGLLPRANLASVAFSDAAKPSTEKKGTGCIEM
jgi:hypothetical protein